MSALRWLRHRLAHLLGVNGGRVQTWWYEGKLMVGFQCSCGRIDGVHESVIQ